MAPMTEQEIIDKIAAYLRSNYGETLVRCEFLDDQLNDEGDGRLVTECTVRVGASTSNWRKTFTFRNGEIVNMTWQRLR